MMEQRKFLGRKEKKSIYFLAILSMLVMSCSSFVLFFYFSIVDASVGVSEILLIIIGFLFLAFSILILRVKGKAQDFLYKNAQRRKRFVSVQKSDNAIIFSTRTILIAITTLNVILFVGGSIWSVITLDSIREQYISAQDEIDKVHKEYGSAKSALYERRRALEKTVSDIERKTNDLNKQITEKIDTHGDAVKSKAEKAKKKIEKDKDIALQAIKTDKDVALGAIEQSKVVALSVIGKIIFDKNKREKFRKDLLTQIRAELIENFKAKYKSKDLGRGEQFGSDITDGVVDKLIDELDKKKLKEEISKELVKKYQESKLVEQVSTQSVTENKKKTGTTKGKAKRQ